MKIMMKRILNIIQIQTNLLIVPVGWCTISWVNVWSIKTLNRLLLKWSRNAALYNIRKSRKDGAGRGRQLS